MNISSGEGPDPSRRAVVQMFGWELSFSTERIKSPSMIQGALEASVILI
jgi:hypothetical protein